LRPTLNTRTRRPFVASALGPDVNDLSTVIPACLCVARRQVSDVKDNVADKLRRYTRTRRPFVASGLGPDVNDLSTVIPACLCVARRQANPIPSFRRRPESSVAAKITGRVRLVIMKHNAAPRT